MMQLGEVGHLYRTRGCRRVASVLVEIEMVAMVCACVGGWVHAEYSMFFILYSTFHTLSTHQVSRCRTFHTLSTHTRCRAAGSFMRGTFSGALVTAPLGLPLLSSRCIWPCGGR